MSLLERSNQGAINPFESSSYVGRSQLSLYFFLEVDLFPDPMIIHIY